MDGLISVLDRMTPRWRAVTQSVKAQLDHEQQEKTKHDSDQLPFIDAKFVIDRSNQLNKYENLHDAFLENGIEVSTEKRMDESDLSRYKCKCQRLSFLCCLQEIFLYHFSSLFTNLLFPIITQIILILVAEAAPRGMAL